MDRCKGLLDSGAAVAKFMAICHAQGGFTEPAMATHRLPVLAARAGFVLVIDNRRLAKVAKLAGAPGRPCAGIDFRWRIGDSIRAGDTLYEVHAHTRGELDYALDYAASHPDIVTIGEML
jgi:thymidine phosphorylase